MESPEISLPHVQQITLKCILLFQLLIQNYYPQRAQRAGGISKGLVISWSWLPLTTLVIGYTKSKAKVQHFGGNFGPQYLWTGDSF